MLQFLEINLLTICNLGTKSCIKCIKSGPPFIPHQSLGHTPPASYKFPHFAIKNFEFAFKPFSLGDFQNAHCCLISLNVIFFSLQSLISIFKSYTYHQIHRNCPQRRIPILSIHGLTISLSKIFKICHLLRSLQKGIPSYWRCKKSKKTSKQLWPHFDSEIKEDFPPF